MVLEALIILLMMDYSHNGDIEMVLKALIKPLKVTMVSQPEKVEQEVQKFISQGGALAAEELVPKSEETNLDHRLTLRIPQWLMDKVDEKRKERTGFISRNLWILEQLEKACKK